MSKNKDKSNEKKDLLNPNIKQFGHPVLRQVSKAIDKIESEDNQELYKKLLAELQTVAGVGLAAPQLGISKRVFVADISKSDWSDNEPISLTVCINPEIKSSSTDLESDWEGCLSAPGLWGMVTRPKKVTVEFFSTTGEKVTKDLSGLAARVFQHELDHLDGILFVDRMNDMTTLMTDQEFRKRAQ